MSIRNRFVLELLSHISDWLWCSENHFWSDVCLSSYCHRAEFSHTCKPHSTLIKFRPILSDSVQTEPLARRRRSSWIGRWWTKQFIGTQSIASTETRDSSLNLIFPKKNVHEHCLQTTIQAMRRRDFGKRTVKVSKNGFYKNQVIQAPKHLNGPGKDKPFFR